MMTDRPVDTGPLADVEASAADGGWTLMFTRQLRHPAEKVWAALTEATQLGAWAPFTSDRDLTTPGDATLTMVDGDTREEMPARIRWVERPTMLEYTWANDVLRWELESVPGGTRLTLRHTSDSREWLPKTAAGWHLCLDVAERLLDGQAVEPIRGEDARQHGWDELHAAYAARLGIEVTD